MNNNQTLNFKCILCGKTEIGNLISQKIRDDDTGRYKIFSCSSCGHVQMFPIPLSEEEKKFYNNDQQTRNVMKNVDFSLLKEICSSDTDRRVKWIRSILPATTNTKTLDIGCGYGFLVDALDNCGYDSYGMDISKQRLSYANEESLGNFINTNIDDKEIKIKFGGTFDLVSAFHVLEHIRDPAYFINNCMDFIKPKGYLLIEVPNLNDESIKHIEPYKAFYWQRAHLSYFDSQHLKIALDKSGFKNYKISGIQRYSIENLFSWIYSGKPQISAPIYHTKHPLLSKLESFYKEDREENLSCDTIIATIRK